jgi:hypothetical protein
MVHAVPGEDPSVVSDSRHRCRGCQAAKRRGAERLGGRIGVVGDRAMPDPAVTVGYCGRRVIPHARASPPLLVATKRNLMVGCDQIPLGQTGSAGPTLGLQRVEAGRGWPQALGRSLCAS